MTAPGSSAEIFINLGNTAHITCHTADRYPVLMISDTGLQLHLSPATPTISLADLALADQLAAAVAAYRKALQARADDNP